MKLCNITRCIYNSNCSLFDDEDMYRQIYSCVRSFLWKQSKLKNSPFKSVSTKWGVYSLKNSFVTQLELCFDNWEYDVVEKKPVHKPQQNLPDLFS